MISVIICTHNPRLDWLDRVLLALRAQTLPPDRWNLLIVDNASQPLVTGLALDWHPAGRIVVETVPGLTQARLRGIEEAKGDLLVFVDDDNLLAQDYLERASAIAEAWPMLGVWGCGKFIPEWESAPSPEITPYLQFLAVNEAPCDRWSNQLYDYAAMAAGAGLCVRRAVACGWRNAILNDPRRKALGRTGTQLSGCEDFDIALTAVDIGYGTAVFRELAITHIIPKSRLEESYLLRLVEGHAFSISLLMALRDPASRPARKRWIDNLREWRLRRYLSPVECRIRDARKRGEQRALESLEQGAHSASSEPVR